MQHDFAQSRRGCLWPVLTGSSTQLSQPTRVKKGLQLLSENTLGIQAEGSRDVEKESHVLGTALAQKKTEYKLSENKFQAAMRFPTARRVRFCPALEELRWEWCPS